MPARSVSWKESKSILKRKPKLLNEFAPDGFQPLGLAAFFGHTEVVRFLIESGADVDTPSRNGLKVTPLNSAAAGRHYEIAMLLLERGANPNMRQSGDFVPCMPRRRTARSKWSRSCSSTAQIRN